MKNALKQRWFYLKNFNKGLSIVFLMPGALREYFRKNNFFKSVTRTCKEITLHEHADGQISLHAGTFDFDFPKKCFYEGDFFDIVYPALGIRDQIVDTFIYENPFYGSEGCYEDFGATLKSGDFAIDAGANAGMFSVVASRKVGPNGKVFAFEPLKEISSYLQKNIEKNHCENIVVAPEILGDSNKDVEFFYNLNHNFNGASTKMHHEGDTVVKLKQMTLDSYVKEHNLAKVDFIKADIEGAERDLVKGAEQTIKQFKPKIALRTYHLPDDPEVLEKLLRDFVPEYNIKHNKKTIYAWI